ncbi:MqnA/MqnD/SBP family protein [Desulfurella sp.]|uniref:menaquinone biosynthesis family protein n=1 Tax=Desulfurella sp. TaxID=1962857 RepID=UPI0025C413E5|nr:MqnA/MqnD/SBP family protein [Desulfurella sp.]
MKKLTLAHSPDSDDAFMFYALNINAIETHGYAFEQILSDIQTLNEKALEAVYDITAISLAVYPLIQDKYDILKSGASMGFKYGPIIVSKKPMSLEEIKKSKIAIPGIYTSAFLELQLLLGKDLDILIVPFNKIFDHVLNGDAQAGLVIHEGQLTYKDFNLYNVFDIGKWWYEKTKLPLPLGVNSIKKDLEDKSLISDILQKSILYSLEHRSEAVKYALEFARGMETSLADQFIGMYVNKLTVDMGEDGLKACQLLLDEAYKSGLIKKSAKITLV